MITLAQVDFGAAVQDGFASVANFMPKLLAFLAILIIGWLIARVLARVVDAILERVGFDRAVERGGVRRALARTQYDASDLLAKLVYYAVLLFVLQLAFGVFGPNPISDLLFGVIAFLPRIFVAILIIVIAAAIAAAVRELVDTAVGGLSYGRLLANGAGAVILGIGVFAALSQLRIAPAIVNGLFYAILAIIVGVTVIAVGGGGIAPMRQRWERALDRVDAEAPQVREEAASTSREDLEQRARERSRQLDGAEDRPGAATGRGRSDIATDRRATPGRAQPDIADDRREEVTGTRSGQLDESLTGERRGGDSDRPTTPPNAGDEPSPRRDYDPRRDTPPPRER